MIKYILAGDILSEPGHHKMNNIRELSNDEMTRFYEAEKSLGTFNISFSLFEICAENFHAIEDYYNSLGFFTGGNQLDFHKIVIKWNSLTLNYLTSYRAFIDHQEATFGKFDDPIKSTFIKFKERTAFHYDNHFSYRFLWNLRNYIQHCGFPASDWGFSEITDGPEKGKSHVEISYNRDDLLKGFNWKKLTIELENLPPKIGVIELFREFQASIEDIAQSVGLQNIAKSKKQFDFLNDLLLEVVSHYPDAGPCILKWEEQEGSTPKLVDIVQFPLRVMTNIRNTLHQ